MSIDKQELRKEWVKALRSGEYEQGVGALCMGGKYCCLGVLCEVYNRMAPLDQRLQVEEGGLCRHYDHFSFDAPYNVAEAVGLMNQIGALDPGSEACQSLCEGVNIGDCTPSLSMLNDRGKSFQQIADLIEQYPEIVFDEE